LIGRQKIVTGDFVGDSYLETKFGAKMPTGDSGHMREILPIYLFIYLYPLLGTHLQVRPVELAEPEVEIWRRI